MKKFFAICFAAFIIPFSANAVCTSVTKQDANEICFNRGQPIDRCIQFETLQSNSPSQWATQITEIIQSQVIDNRQLLTATELDEETRFFDPHREDFYHGDANGTHHHNPSLDDHLVARCDIVEVVWNGSEFIVTVRSARRTHTPEGDLIQ